MLNGYNIVNSYKEELMKKISLSEDKNGYANIYIIRKNDIKQEEEFLLNIIRFCLEKILEHKYNNVNK